MSSTNRSQTFGGCSAVYRKPTHMPTYVYIFLHISLYRKATHTDQYLHYSSHHQTSCKESVVSSLFNRAYSIITNKNDLHKETLEQNKC